ncbi:MAG TPA: hypothetical protein VKR82_10130 [Candidatus Acidoferrales bacterium]|nr:hypothetical protein [Candidatus Acidoferrales bacterium]
MARLARVVVANIPYHVTQRGNARQFLLVAAAESWPWSSAPAHCGQAESALGLDMEKWRKRWTSRDWQVFLLAGETVADLQAIRENTHNGRPLGTPEFVKQLEGATLRRLTPQKGGKPPHAKRNVETQLDIDFA